MEKGNKGIGDMFLRRHRESLDLRILQAFRSLAGKSAAGDFAIAFCATWLFYLLLLLAIVAIVETPGTNGIRIVTVALLAVGVAEVISWTVGLLFFRERPFTHLKFTPLVWMPPRWKSFPSDHTTIGFTVALVFLFLAHPLGPLLLALATAVGLARIAAGVHYPSDVVAGAFLAAAVAAAVVPLTRSLPLL